jgi:hypothetical protein
MKVATIVLLILFSSPESWAKDLLNVQEANPQIEKCLQEILTSKLIKVKFPELLTNKYDPSSYAFLREVDQYCVCHAKSLSFEQELKERDYIGFEFRDKSKGHQLMDQCSLNNFSKYNLGLFFEIMVSTRVRYKIENKLEGRMIAGVKQFASEGSVRSRLLCLETKILQQCTKIQSISSTFKCVSQFFFNSQRMDNIEKLCPSFRPHGNDQDFQAMGDLI